MVTVTETGVFGDNLIIKTRSVELAKEALDRKNSSVVWDSELKCHSSCGQIKYEIKVYF